jgi:hypothetical protein
MLQLTIRPIRRMPPDALRGRLLVRAAHSPPREFPAGRARTSHPWRRP